MTKKHSTNPLQPNLENCNIGQIPSHAGFSDPAIQIYQYLRSWRRSGQVFTFSGPGPIGGDSDEWFKQKNPPYDYETNTDPCYEVILRSPPKVNTSDPNRSLYGVLLPWQKAPHYDRCLGEITVPATVTWEAERGDGEYEQTIYSSTSYSQNWVSAQPLDIDNNSDGVSAFKPNLNNPIHLYNATTDVNLIDGNCNAPHTFCWGSGNDALITKTGTSPTPASGSLCTKITYNSTANAYAYPKLPQSQKTFKAGTTPIVPGRTYDVKFDNVGNGVSYMTVVNGAQALYSGSSSTTWHRNEEFSFTATHWRLEFRCIGTGYVALDNVSIKERGTFDYEPDSGGEYVVGKLRTNRIRVAALSIFDCPDRLLEPEQAELLPRHISQGKAIRGYDASGDKSLGTLIQRIGNGPYTDFDQDDAESNTRRALFSWGHPCGIGTTSSTEHNIRAAQDSWFAVETRNLKGLSGSDVQQVMPVVVAYAEGASGGDPAYIRFTSNNGGSNDTSVIEITDSGGLQTASSYISLRDGIDYIKITIQAPSSGKVWLKSVSIFEIYPYHA